jgi:hypothetical protein
MPIPCVTAMTGLGYVVSLVILALGTRDTPGSMRTSAAVGPTRVCITFLNHVQEVHIDARALDHEVNRIWAPYGVAVDGLRGSCRGDSARNVTVRLHAMARVPPSTRGTVPESALGSIIFVDGRPEPTIALWLDQAARMMDTSIRELTSTSASPRWRLLLARVLGRSLAHELGHYLLASQSHTDAGLMRRQFLPYDIATNDARAFALGSDQVAALSRRVGAWQATSGAPVAVATLRAKTADPDASLSPRR